MFSWSIRGQISYRVFGELALFVTLLSFSVPHGLSFAARSGGRYLVPMGRCVRKF